MNKLFQILYFLGLILCVYLVSTPVDQIGAATTIPKTINYQGRLLTSTGAPVTATVVFRFSIWDHTDFDAGTDIDGSGAIIGSAPGYAGWSEVQLVIPDANGLFDIQIGAVTPVPDLNFDTAKYIQIEVKDSGLPDTSYEVLDPKPADALDDRKPFSSAPFAFNADKLDNRDVGTGSGDIVILDATGKFDVSFIPNFTDESVFTLDNDDTEASKLSLVFGKTLSKTLSYDISAGQFVFNDDLQVEGDFSASGSIVLGTSTGNTLTINAKLANDLDFDQNSALNFVLEKGTAFPSSPVAGQKFFRTDLAKEYVYNGSSWDVTSGGGSASGAVVVTYTPEYQGFTLFPDGSDNIGTMSSDYEEGTGSGKRIFYKWTSNKVTLQDFDVVVKFQIPSDFLEWDATPIEIDYKTADGLTTSNKVDVVAFDTTGTGATLTGATGLASSSWTTAGIGFSGSPTWTPNGYLILRVKMSALSTKFTQIGDIRFKYKSS